MQIARTLRVILLSTSARERRGHVIRASLARSCQPLLLRSLRLLVPLSPNRAKMLRYDVGLLVLALTLLMDMATSAKVEGKV